MVTKSDLPAAAPSERLFDKVTELPTASVDQRVRRIVTAQNYEGPIPPPALFKQYGEVVADAPERILKVFEEDSRHVREIHVAALEAQKRDNRRVHWMAFALIAGGLSLSVLFAYWGKDWLAGIILGTTLAGTVSGLLTSLRSKEKADEEEPSPAKRKK